MGRGPGSPTYNTGVLWPQFPLAVSENRYDSGPIYDYAVDMAVNPKRIPGEAPESS